MYICTIYVSQSNEGIMSNPINLGFPGGSVVKNPPARSGNVGSIPGSERSPGDHGHLSH